MTQSTNNTPTGEPFSQKKILILHSIFNITSRNVTTTGSPKHSQVQNLVIHTSMVSSTILSETYTLRTKNAGKEPTHAPVC